MPQYTPYLQRRRDAFAFRIAVPIDLRHTLGLHEITKGLGTSDKREAIPKALMLAARAKALFHELRMKKKKGAPLLRVDYTFKVDLDDLGRPTSIQVEAEPDEQEAVNSAIKAVLDSKSSPKAATNSLFPRQSAGERKLTDALAAWKRLKNPAPGSVDAYTFAVSRFEGRHPDLFIENIERRHIRDYLSWLQGEGKSDRTIEKEHAIIRAMLAIAEHEEWIATNPARGTILPTGNPGEKIRSYNIDELNKIFNSPVFAEGFRPRAGKGEAAYWIPLLLLFTGARRDEIAQLTTDRVREYNGVKYFAIDTIDEGARLKTEESRRAVPIHQQLVVLGFNEYVAQRAKDGGGQLFPLLKPNKRGQYGAKWGDWWGRYVRETVGIADERVNPAHSFRHLFITECRRLGFREDYERAVVGHVKGAGRKDDHDDYGEHHIEALAEAVNKIDFQGLNLSFLYR